MASLQGRVYNFFTTGVTTRSVMWTLKFVVRWSAAIDQLQSQLKMAAQLWMRLLPMANFINLAGEARDFEHWQAKWISTGQIYPTNPQKQCEPFTILYTTYPVSAKIGLYRIMQWACLISLNYSAKTWFSKENPTEDIQVFWIPSNQKIRPHSKLILSLHTFRPARAHTRTRRKLTIISLVLKG